MRPRNRSTSILRALSLFATMAIGCSSGGEATHVFPPLGAECAGPGARCETGLCLIAPGDSVRRCLATCGEFGAACPTGGLCVAIDDAAPRSGTSGALLACTPPRWCSANGDCGTNASCNLTSGGRGFCQCLASFSGDPDVACGVCVAANARDGCTFDAIGFLEVRGRCRAADGSATGASCAHVSDCPDPSTQSCFGYLPAKRADPPCSCTDLRGKALASASTLSDLERAWYDDATTWPNGFDPKVSGALGPGAQLAGIDLSGEAPVDLARAVVGTAPLSPNPPFDGTAKQFRFEGAQALLHRPIVSGSVIINLGESRLTDAAAHRALVGGARNGTIDYETGALTLELATAPPSSLVVTAQYAHRKIGVTLRLLAQSGATLSLGANGPLDALPRSLRIRVTPEPLVPDAPLDGVRTQVTFTLGAGLAKVPIVPGTVRIIVGNLTLADSASDGVLSAEDGSQGTVDYQTGDLSLMLLAAPATDAVTAARYQTQRTEALVPDAAFDGARKSLTFSRAHALTYVPLRPERARVTIGELVFTGDASGALSAPDGSTGRIDSESGDLWLELTTAPLATAGASVRYATEAALTLTDRLASGVLTGDGTGTADDSQGTFQIVFARTPMPGSRAVVDYVRQAPATVTPTPAFDGLTTQFAIGLAPAPLTPGSVQLSLGAEAPTLTPPPDGAASAFTTTLDRPPVAPGSLSLLVGMARLNDTGEGALIGEDGSAGTVDYASGAITLQMTSAPAAAALSTADYVSSVAPERLTPDVPFDEMALDFTFTGGASKLPIAAASSVVRVLEGASPDLSYDGAARAFMYTFERTPIAPGTMRLTVGEVLLTDADVRGQLAAMDGSAGTIDYVRGVASVQLASAPASGARSVADYEVRSFEEPLIPNVPFDGVTQAHQFTGSGALQHPPIVPGSLTVTIGTTQLTDLDGALVANDGSRGTVSYETGAMSVELALAPLAGASATARYRIAHRGEALIPDSPFDGAQLRFDFTGARALWGRAIEPGSLIVAVEPVSLVPDAPYDGITTARSYAGANALRELPAVPGTVLVNVDARSLSDDGAGSLVGDGTGTVDYVTGAIAIDFTSAPIAGTDSTVRYRRSVSGEALRPNVPYNGTRTRFTYRGTEALANVPVEPGTVVIDVGSLRITDAAGAGTLSAADGTTGALDYDSGAFWILFAGAPAAGAATLATYEKRAAVVLRDVDGTGALLGDDGSSGTVDLGTGALQVAFIIPPAASAMATAAYETRAPEVARPAVPFDGTTPTAEFSLLTWPITQGSLRLVIQDTELVESSPGILTANDGSSGTVDAATGAVSVRLAVPPAAGVAARAEYRSSAAVVLTEREVGALVAADGSFGTIDSNSGALSLSLTRPPAPTAEVELAHGVSSQRVLSDAKTPGVLEGADGSLGTIDYATGAATLELTRAPAASAVLAASFEETTTFVDRTNLDGITLSDAVLTRANLSYASLRNASLARADLSGADLTGADLEGANLGGANLAGASLDGANLSGADLGGADLSGVDLAGVTGVDATNPALPEWYRAGISDCTQITVRGCTPGRYYPEQLVYAIANGQIDPTAGGLAGAALAGADLTGLRSLEGANLQGANLRGANLTGLRMSGANLTAAVLTDAILNRVDAPDTRCPTGGGYCYGGGATCADGATACAADDAGALLLVAADLTGAQTNDAVMTGADASDATFVRTQLRNTNLTRAKLVGTGTAASSLGKRAVDLTGANLAGTVFAAADLTNALMESVTTGPSTRFTEATLVGAKLNEADISGADLTAAKLMGASLKGIKSDGTNFAGADLTGADLTGADLRGARLVEAKLDGAKMIEVVADARTEAPDATFIGADLTDACLTNARLLRGATLTGVRLVRASLVGAQLSATDFTGVDLTGATLGAELTPGPGAACRCTPEGGPSACGVTNLRGTNFTMANLTGADLSYADFRGVNFTQAGLRNAVLVQTDLRNANLSAADLAGGLDLTSAILSLANFAGANLSDANLAGNEMTEPSFAGADLSRVNLRGTIVTNGGFQGAVLDSVLSSADTSLRSANLELSTIRGCFRGNLSDASLKNASLAQAAFVSPTSGRIYDAAIDFNCRVDFEGALLSAAANTMCGASTPFPAGWIAAGRTGNQTFAKERLVSVLPSVRSQLDCAYLPKVDLRGFALAGASLRGAALGESRLGRDDRGVATNLEGAALGSARLASANLEWANLRGASLASAVLTGASLKHADLRSADLSFVVLDDTTSFQLAKYSCPGRQSAGCTRFPSYDTFRWRQLMMIGPQSNLEGIDLSAYPGLSSPPVDLSGANLKNANLTWTSLAGVDFTGANLQGANLSNATVSAALFRRANLKSANLSSATLSGATSFSGANLIEANFVAVAGTPNVGGALCSQDTSFSNAATAYVLILEISIEGSFPLYFPVITIDLVPGWNVSGRCCFPLFGGIRIGC